MLFSEPKIPQTFRRETRQQALNGFSALQRAENSSNRDVIAEEITDIRVSVLFSEPKIPQTPQQRPRRVAVEVSVLFSEPKIPQIKLSAVDAASGVRFSALQRAENSSKRGAFGALEQVAVFQCSSASRKFLKCIGVDLPA